MKKTQKNGMLKRGLTAGVTGKGGIWRTKPPDAESAFGADSPKVWANARTCPVHAVLALLVLTELAHSQKNARERTV